jgi:5-(carboxyamino)imidazole ribonucleotide synthase
MRVGVLGGGQLGRMLALAGHRLGFTFRFLDPSSDAPARRVGELVVGDWSDAGAIERFVSGLDLVTYEFENVPASAAHRIADETPVFPPVAALETAQDRLCEKALFNSLGIPTAPYAPVSSLAELEAAVDGVGAPGILKTRRAGYDGKGQARLGTARDTGAAWAALTQGASSAELIYERFVDFEREVSVVGVRSADGATAMYPLTRNVHAAGILRASFAPDGDGALERRAHAATRAVMERLRYVGVMAIELFVVRDASGASTLVANEIAPRVHNSGHWTIEGAVTSQFENHLRAIAGLPLGETSMVLPGAHAAMLNLIGATGPLAGTLAIPGAHAHLYGKQEREGRKVGHVTFVGTDPRVLEDRVRASAELCGQRLV